MDKNNLKVLGFAGSLRRGSYNKALLRAAADLTSGFDWEVLTESKSESESKEPKPMHRSYPGSDIWECDNCGLKGDVHQIENHISYCDKKQQQQKKQQTESKQHSDTYEYFSHF